MKNPSLKTLKRKLWELCKQIIRRRCVLKDGSYKCYTCDRTIENPQDAHCGHLIPSGASGAFLRYDLRNLKICCYNCNVNLGGNGAEFYKRMVKEVGQKAVDKLFADKNIIVKADRLFYLQKIAEYEKILN